jgi:hypothetical protein
MRTTLIRQVAVGESLSFDGGRIVLTVQEKSGRRSALKLTLAEDVVVDKPRIAANDDHQDHRGIANLKS